MAHGPECRLPVAEAPVNRDVGQRGLSLHELPHTLDVPVRDAHHLLHDGGILQWQPVGPGRRRFPPAGWPSGAAAAMTTMPVTPGRPDRNERRSMLIYPSVIGIPSPNTREVQRRLVPAGLRAEDLEEVRVTG